MTPDPNDPEQLAADGDDVPDGVDPPTETELLEYLAASDWPT